MHDVTPLTLAAALSALLTSLLGVDHQVAVVAAAGYFAGSPLAPKVDSRLVAAAWFVAVVVLCSVAGHATADALFDGHRRPAQFWAGAYAALFHPLLTALVAAVPDFVAALVAAAKLWRGQRP